MKKTFSVASVAALLLGAAVSSRAQNWDHGVSLFNQKQYREAIREFHGVLRSNPGYWQAWYFIGFGHFQLKEYEDAVDSFQSYIKGAAGHEKEQSSGYYYSGFSYYQMKQYDRAIPALVRYMSLSEKLQQRADPSARAALGRSYIFTDHYAEAIPVLTAAAGEMKTNANNYYYLGFAQRKLGHEDQAVTAFNQALAIDPRDADSLGSLAEIYLARSRQTPAAVKQAVSIGERLIAVKNDEQAWGVLGQAYLADQQYAKAAALLDKYAKAHADSSAAWYNLGVSLSRSEQWKPAEQALEQAVKVTPTNNAALLELGYVYESDKQLDKALAVYKRAYDASGGKDDNARASMDRVKQSMQKPE